LILASFYIIDEIRVLVKFVAKLFIQYLLRKAKKHFISFLKMHGHTGESKTLINHRELYEGKNIRPHLIQNKNFALSLTSGKRKSEKVATNLTKFLKLADSS